MKLRASARSAVPDDPAGPGGSGSCASTDTARTRRVGGQWLLGGLIFLVHLFSPEVTVGDSRLSAVTAWRALTQLDLHLESLHVVTSLKDHYDLVPYDGHLLPYFPWPTMLFALPADVVLFLTGHDPGTLTVVDPARTFLVEIPTAAAIVTVTALLIRVIVMTLLPPAQRASSRLPALCALVFAFSTSAWSIGSRALWQQTVSMMFVALAVLAVRRLDDGRRWPVLLGIAVAAMPLVRPTDAVFAALIGCWLLARRRDMLIRVLIPGVLVLAVFFAISAWQYGSPLPPYYLPSRLGATAPIGFGEGLALNLVSPSRGLLIYDPVLALAVAGVLMRLRRKLTGPAVPENELTALDLVMAGAIVAQLLVIAKFGSTGGHAFGPRLMMDILPLVIILAAPTLSLLVRPRTPAGEPETADGSARNVAPSKVVVGLVVSVVLAGFAINGTGALLRSSRCWNIQPVDVDARPSRIWDWSDPQFTWPYRQLGQGGSFSDVFAPVCKGFS